MGGVLLQLLRVYRLKPALEEAITTKSFLSLKQFQWVVPLIKSEAYWDLHFALIQCLYPLYRLLRLADMKNNNMDKAYYYILQVDRMMQDGVENVMTKMDCDGGRSTLSSLSKVCLRRAAVKRRKNDDTPQDYDANYEEDGKLFCSSVFALTVVSNE